MIDKKKKKKKIYNAHIVMNHESGRDNNLFDFYHKASMSCSGIQLFISAQYSRRFSAI